MRADNLAEEALVNGAEDFDRNVAEEVRGFLAAEVVEETRQPVVTDDQFLAEVGLEEVAVEKRDVRGRAAVERTEVADERVPERALGGAQTAAAEVGGRLLVEFERLLAGTAGGVGISVLAPGSDEAVEWPAGVNVAVVADAEEEDTI